MKLLVDTHVVIWWLGQPKRIPASLRATMLDASNEVFVSAATAWEIAVKCHIGKLEFDSAFLTSFDESIRELGFGPLPVTASHAVRGAEIDAPHKDPFDRMLAGQALVEGMTMVSADPAFKLLGIEPRWR